MAARLPQGRTAAAGERQLHDMQQNIALGGAAEGLQVRGMRRLAARAQRLVELRRGAYVLHKAGTWSIACSLDRAAVAGTRNRAHLGEERETVLTKGCRCRRRQAARQGPRGARQPHNHFGEAGDKLRQDGRPGHGWLAPLLRLVGQAPVRDHLRGAKPLRSSLREVAGREACSLRAPVATSLYNPGAAHMPDSFAPGCAGWSLPALPRTRPSQ